MNHAEWIETLTPGTIVNCYYNRSRKTIFRAWMRSSNCGSGYLVRVHHTQQWIDSAYLRPCKNQTLPIGITRPRVD